MHDMCACHFLEIDLLFHGKPHFSLCLQIPVMSSLLSIVTPKKCMATTVSRFLPPARRGRGILVVPGSVRHHVFPVGAKIKKTTGQIFLKF